MVAWFSLTALVVAAALQAQRSSIVHHVGTLHEAISGAGAGDTIAHQVTGSTTHDADRVGRRGPRAPVTHRPAGPQVADRAAMKRGALVLLMLMAQGPRPVGLGPR